METTFSRDIFREKTELDDSFLSANLAKIRSC